MWLLTVAACGRGAATEPAVEVSGPRTRDAAVAAGLDATAPIDAAGADRSGPAIVDWPIAWPPARDAAMLAYRRAHVDPDAVDTTITPRMIVLHYTAGGSAQATKAYFDRPQLEAARAQLRAGGKVNVSAHFLVDRDGTIYRLMPETRMGRHTIGVNHLALGVENVGDERRWPLTDAQVAANVALIRELAARHPIAVLVGHHEVRALDGTAWFVERDPAYRNRKADPGPRFMAAVRAELGALGLRGVADAGIP